jgi:GT2 family glycosyltransferase
MAVRTDLLKKVGGFDTSYVGLGEFHEPDVSFKIRDLGFKILFDPRAAVMHLVSEGGYFSDRPDSYGRAVNLVNFYARHIRTDRLDKIVRLLSYLLFLDMYWLYAFFKSGRASQLRGLGGTITALARNSLRRPWHGRETRRSHEA